MERRRGGALEVVEECCGEIVFHLLIVLGEWVF